MSTSPPSPSLHSIKNILLILSGKGGVGKSSITTQLALSLSLQNLSVGVLDIDLTGPSIPRLFNIEDAKVRQTPGGWLPVTVHEEIPGVRGRLVCMSLGFLLKDRGDAVVWRGPKKTAMVRQFLSDVCWDADADGEGLDYLLIDTPPGTSDEHISLVETLLKTSSPAQLAGAVIVTTPQAISIADVRKEINFCRKTGVPIRGVVENMAGFVCPHCAECSYVFSKGGGEIMANEFGVPFLASVPIDPLFVALVEEGATPVYPEGTEVEGRVWRGRDGGEEGSGEAEAELVEKYRCCLLSGIFERVARRLVGEIG